MRKLESIENDNYKSKEKKFILFDYHHDSRCILYNPRVIISDYYKLIIFNNILSRIKKSEYLNSTLLNENNMIVYNDFKSYLKTHFNDYHNIVFFTSEGEEYLLKIILRYKYYILINTKTNIINVKDFKSRSVSFYDYYLEDEQLNKLIKKINWSL